MLRRLSFPALTASKKSSVVSASSSSLLLSPASPSSSIGCCAVVACATVVQAATHRSFSATETTSHQRKQQTMMHTTTSNSNSGDDTNNVVKHQKRNIMLDRLRQNLQRGGRGGSKRLKMKAGTLTKLLQRSGGSPQQQEPASLREQMMLIHHERRKSKIPEAIQKKKRAARVFSRLFDMPFYFKEEDIREASVLGRGPGGQATNRRKQTCQIQHIPTGIVIKFSKFRSLHSNRKAARMVLSNKLEERLFGRYSKLGMAAHSMKVRKRIRDRQRKRLLKLHERAVKQEEEVVAGQGYQQHPQRTGQKKRHHSTATTTAQQQRQQQQQGEEENASSGGRKYSSSSSINTNSSSLSCCQHVFRVPSLYEAVVGNVSPTLFKAGCWKQDVGFLVLSNTSENSTTMIPPAWADVCNACSGLLLDDADGTAGGGGGDSCSPSARRELLEPPFVDSWWNILECCCLLHHHHDDAASFTQCCELGSVHCPLPPLWFCLLFPRFLSSPLHKFVGPVVSWEARERSYFKHAVGAAAADGNGSNSSMSGCSSTTSVAGGVMMTKLLRQPYPIFFEMFGLRVEKSNDDEYTISSIERDVGLNWFEGRRRFESPLAPVLWLHVLTSATEFEFTDILVAASKLLRDVAEKEKHEAARDAVARVLRVCGPLLP